MIQEQFNTIQESANHPLSWNTALGPTAPADPALESLDMLYILHAPINIPWQQNFWFNIKHAWTAMRI